MKMSLRKKYKRNSTTFFLPLYLDTITAALERDEMNAVHMFRKTLMQMYYIS